MKRKIKVILENYLKRLSDNQSDKVSNAFTFIKSKLGSIYPGLSIVRPLIRLCDFIIVRSNGNRFIEFELSNICNARCVFCPYPDMLRTDKKFMHMNEQTLDRIVGSFQHFKGVLVSFTPTTGDTLLHPEWDKYIHSIIQLPQVGRATMFTNAIELDLEAIDRLIVLLRRDRKGKFSQLYLSLGGYSRDSYKNLYQVDRFEKVRGNIDALFKRLKLEKICLGVHFHIKLEKGVEPNTDLAMNIYNREKYPYVYVSHSVSYFSNDAYKRNALIDYYSESSEDHSRACAYLNKTRFAADGSIWADGCVISEMPDDASLKLGNLDLGWETLEAKRNELVSNWELNREIPQPCKGCTMYRPRK
jgi:hypothetical protein